MGEGAISWQQDKGWAPWRGMQSFPIRGHLMDGFCLMARGGFPLDGAFRWILMKSALRTDQSQHSK